MHLIGPDRLFIFDVSSNKLAKLSCAARLLLGLALSSLPLGSTGGWYEASAASPTCSELRRVDTEIMQFDETLSVFRFLDRYDNHFSETPYYVDAQHYKKLLEEHRASADGQKYRAICWMFSTGSDKLFCEEHKKRDDELKQEYTRHLERFQELANDLIAANPDFVALGENGRPLATNAAEFAEVHRRYEQLVLGQIEDIKQKKAWLQSWLERSPQIHTRCGIFVH